jgi:predicted RNA-binding Zn ribbon-like protein
MTVSRVSPYLPSFIGGVTCLDFVNTVDPRHDELRDDCLRDYAQLLRWAVEARVLTADEHSRLAARSQEEPGLAGGVHSRALELREALYRLFTTERPARADLDRLTDETHRAWARAELAWTSGGWAWRWDSPTELDRVLWPIARSAAELLTSDQLDRVRECEGLSGCGWLFLDTSKNGRRRWCDMRVCGNRAKARRHRQRELAVTTASPASRQALRDFRVPGRPPSSASRTRQACHAGPAPSLAVLDLA